MCVVSSKKTYVVCGGCHWIPKRQKSNCECLTVEHYSSTKFKSTHQPCLNFSIVFLGLRSRPIHNKNQFCWWLIHQAADAFMNAFTKIACSRFRYRTQLEELWWLAVGYNHCHRATFAIDAWRHVCTLYAVCVYTSHMGNGWLKQWAWAENKKEWVNLMGTGSIERKKRAKKKVTHNMRGFLVWWAAAAAATVWLSLIWLCLYRFCCCCCCCARSRGGEVCTIDNRWNNCCCTIGECSQLSNQVGMVANLSQATACCCCCCCCWIRVCVRFVIASKHVPVTSWAAFNCSAHRANKQNLYTHYNKTNIETISKLNKVKSVDQSLKWSSQAALNVYCTCMRFFMILDASNSKLNIPTIYTIFADFGCGRSSFVFVRVEYFYFLFNIGSIDEAQKWRKFDFTSFER